jgi:hypothetical protein
MSGASSTIRGRLPVTAKVAKASVYDFSKPRRNSVSAALARGSSRPASIAWTRGM